MLDRVAAGGSAGAVPALEEFAMKKEQFDRAVADLADALTGTDLPFQYYDERRQVYILAVSGERAELHRTVVQAVLNFGHNMGSLDTKTLISHLNQSKAGG
jgi:hypothetical protein